MPGLSLFLLGTFRVCYDAGPAIHFETNKARALLAYLAVERRAHTRLHLAGLLWPDWPDATARTYLRQALLNLRQVLERHGAALPYLLSNRQTIQFNPESDHWLDVDALATAVLAFAQLSDMDPSPQAVRRLADAVDLYRGDFLAGFFLDGCSAYEEWQLLTREQLRREVVEATCWLARWYERHGDLAQAQRYSWRSLQLEPLLEESHLRLMRLLALDGKRNSALSQYGRYCQQLSAELDTVPSREMIDLYERIKTGTFPCREQYPW